MAWRTLLLALAYAAYAKREGEESSLVQVSPPEKRLAPQEAVSLHRKEVDHCSGQAFEVLSHQSCHLLQACSGLTRVCCQKEGETCSGVTSKLTPGDLCYAAYGEAPCNVRPFQEKEKLEHVGPMQAFPTVPWDWWPKALTQTGASVHKVACDGQPFTVVSGDTCYAYQTACPNQKFLCCKQAGQTCTAEKSSLFAQDTCWSSTGRPCEDGPEPEPTATPGPTTSGPTPSMKVGDWIKTWSTHQLTPDPWMVICFSGYVKLSDAMGECSRTKSQMPAGPLWLSLGGGNCDAASGGSVTWSQEVLEDLMASITTVDLSSYEGIFFDLETNSGGCSLSLPGTACGAKSGTSYGTSPSAQLFSQAYDAVQAIGLKVGVSWSYQMPYCMDNAAEIVQVTLASDAVSIVSPQMYNGGGTFTSQEVQAAAWNGNSHVSYSDYVNLKAGGVYPSYTLVNQQYDMTTNLQNMEQMQSAMLSWANSAGIQSFMDSPGCLAYQDS